MKITKSQLKQIIKEEMNEAMGMDQEGQVFSQVLPVLMQVAGNNTGVALEMIETLKVHLQEGAVGEEEPTGTEL